MAVLGLRFCARAFSSCGKRGPLFIAVRGPLTMVASLVAEHRLQTRRLSSCGSRAQLLRGMWDPPRPGLEPVSPASAGRLSTTAPPGKPRGLLANSDPWASPQTWQVGVLAGKGRLPCVGFPCRARWVIQRAPSTKAADWCSCLSNFPLDGSKVPSNFWKDHFWKAF